jgi:hypothetical protein
VVLVVVGLPSSPEMLWGYDSPPRCGGELVQLGQSPPEEYTRPCTIVFRRRPLIESMVACLSHEILEVDGVTQGGRCGCGDTGSVFDTDGRGVGTRHEIAAPVHFLTYHIAIVPLLHLHLELHLLSCCPQIDWAQEHLKKSPCKPKRSTEHYKYNKQDFFPENKKLKSKNKIMFKTTQN